MGGGRIQVIANVVGAEKLEACCIASGILTSAAGAARQLGFRVQGFWALGV